MTSSNAEANEVFLVLADESPETGVVWETVNFCAAFGQRRRWQFCAGLKAAVEKMTARAAAT